MSTMTTTYTERLENLQCGISHFTHKASESIIEMKTADLMEEAQGMYDKAMSDLTKLSQQIQECMNSLTIIQHHGCDYGDDDYCVICGRDGRS